MAKKGIVASVVRTAVAAAEKAISPSPLTKTVIAAAAVGAIGEIERRAKQMVEPVERALERDVVAPAVKTIDAALAEPKPATAPGEAKPPARVKPAARRQKASARSAAAGKRTGTRKKAKGARAAASGARKSAAKRGRATAKKKKAAKSKRR